MVNLPNNSPSTPVTVAARRHLVLWGALSLLWIGGGALIWLGTIAAGGRPTNPIWEWPQGAVSSLLGSDHGSVRPWHWLGASDLDHPGLFTASLVASAVLAAAATLCLKWVRMGGVPAFFPGVTWVRMAPPGAIADRFATRGPARPQHRSRWARSRDLRHLAAGRPGGGVIPLGYHGRRKIGTEPEQSVLLLGPTGKGKSTAYCLPAILEWEGPCVAISIKADLIEYSAGWRQRRGEVHIFDPTQATDYDSTTWSPAADCAYNFQRAWMRAHWMVGTLDKSNTDKAAWEHWLDGARRVLSLALYTGATSGQPMGVIRSWVEDSSGEKLKGALDLIARPDPMIREVWTSLESRPENERRTCFTTSQRMLNIYMEPNVQASARSSALRVDKLLSGDNTLYLVAPQNEQERLAPLFGGLVMTVLDGAERRALREPSRRLPRPLLVVLDECRNTAPIERLANYLSTGRSMAISLMPIFQDFAQIKQRYSDEAGTIINNARAKVFLPGISDLDTLEYAAKLTGTGEVVDTTYGGVTDTSWRMSPKELLPPDLARQLGDGSALLIYDNLPATILAQRPWMDEPDLRRRALTAYVAGARRVVL